MTPEQEKELRAKAQAAGLDPDEVATAAKKIEAEEPSPAPSAKPGEPDAAPAGVESGAKAHGGRGFFAYEFPVLTVNEIRASLFMDPVGDGHLYYSEWIAIHGAAAPSAAPAPY